jgi:uncharacterized protein with GYD domain
MAMYLGRFSYTPEAIRSLIANPEDRSEVARAAIESVGGTLHGFWYAFGEFDGYWLYEMPDDTSAAALAVAIGSGGALSKVETIPLMTVAEGVAAFKKAADASYRPPSG